MKKNIFIDTDMGMDDIIAISMLAASEKFCFKGFSTVFGLVDPYVGKRNLDGLLNYLLVKSEVVSGARLPLDGSTLRKFPKADIENSTKLVFLKNIISERNDNSNRTIQAEDAMFRATKESSGKIRIMCLGPLTNISNAIIKYGDEFLQNVDEFIIMGGNVYCNGNVPPDYCAEYNFFLDPWAAKNVLESGVPITLVSLDSAYSVPTTELFRKKVNSMKPNSDAGQIIRSAVIANNKDFEYFYDPLVAAVLIEPKLIRKDEKLSVRVELSGKNLGRLKSERDGKGNVKLVEKIDRQGFYSLFLKLI